MQTKDILLAVKAAALVDKLAYKLLEAEIERLGRTLRDAERQTTDRHAA